MLFGTASRLLAASALVALALSGLSARADDFTFSITNTVGNVAGTVTGEILGLSHNGTSSATQVLITSGPAGLNSIYTYPVDATTWDYQEENSFTVVNGVLTASDFLAQQTVGGNLQGAQLYIEGGNGNGYNFVNLDGDDVLFVWGDNGPSGVSFAPAVAATPEPSSLILLATGVLGAMGAARRKLMA